MYKAGESNLKKSVDIVEQFIHTYGFISVYRLDQVAQNNNVDRNVLIKACALV